MAGLIVIADDLTGALDTAVQFTKKKLAAMVILNIGADLPEDTDCEVLVIDTESRHLPPEEAAERVLAAVNLGSRIGCKYYYKKIDSTLRGNVGAELGAMLDAGLGSELILVPAFPKMGRTVRNGRLYVNGIPLSETGFSHDPLNPIMESDITRIIAQQTNIPVHVISSPHELPACDDDKKIYLFNAGSDEDLYMIGEHLAEKDRLYLSSGSAGFAGILSNLPVFKPCTLEFTRSCSEYAKSGLPMLIVCGSLNDVSRRQIDFAVSSGYRCISLDPGDLVGDDYIELPAWEQVRYEAAALLKKNENIIIEINASYRLTTESGGKVPINLAERLGQAVKNIIDESSLSTLVIFGGDTAVGILNALHVERLEPQEEILPGVAVTETAGPGYRMHLITKAGGFGDDDLIIKIESLLREGSYTA